jgi:hypothetical protein
MAFKATKSIALQFRRYFASQSKSLVAQELKIPVPWGHIAGKT